MSRLPHEAEATIKRAVIGGPQGRLASCGAGPSGAIDKLQQIFGVSLLPLTRQTGGEYPREFLGDERFASSSASDSRLSSSRRTSTTATK